MGKLVNPIFLVLGLIGVVAFLGLGGIEKGSSFIDKLNRRTTSPISQIKSKIAGGEAIETIDRPSAPTSEIRSIVARRGKSRSPTQLTTTSSGKKFRRSVESGAINQRTNISGGRRISLSAAEIGRVRARPLTAVEQRDVLALTSRFGRKSKSRQRLKTDPLELVLQKREQELISKKVIGESKFVNGKLFANPEFNAPSRSATSTPTIGKSGQLIENLGAGGSAIIKARTETRVQAALDFNRRVAEAKAAGLPLPRF